MAKIGRLSVQIGVDLQKFRADMNSAFNTLNSTTAQMKRSMNGLATAAKVVGAAMAGAFVVKSLAETIYGVAKLADEFNQLKAKISNSLDSAAEFDSVFKKLATSSNRSGIAIDGVAQAFVRLRPVAKDLHATNDQLIRFNETFSKMGILAGATGEEVKYTMIQLSQGLASGTLRGDELRSVLEQMPGVARTIADSMGIPFKDLKQAAKDGQITAEAVFKAILDKSAEVDAQFAKLPPSIGRAINEVVNTLKIMFGEVDKNTHASATLGQVIQTVSRFLAAHKDEIVKVATALVNLIGSVVKFAFKLGELLLRLTPIGIALELLWKKLSGGKGFVDTMVAAINGLAKVFDILAGAIGRAIGAMRSFLQLQKERTKQGVDFFKNIVSGSASAHSYPESGIKSVSFGPIASTQTGKSNVIIMADFVKSVKTAISATEDLKLAGQATFSAWDDAVRQVGDSISSNLDGAFNDFIEKGKISWRQLVSQMLKDIARIVFQQTVSRPIGNAVSGIFGSIFGGIGKSLGGKILGFADGGNPPVGVPSLVGERGPELFVPSTRGTILPSHSLGGGPVVNQYININAIDSKSFKDHLYEHGKDIMGMAIQGVQRQENRMGSRGPMERARA